MKRILQALDTASTQPVEGANDMSRFLRIVKEGAEPIPAMPDVAGIQPGQSKDLGNGEKVTVNADGTVSYQGGWGVYVYNAQGQHVKTQSPTFAGYNQTTDAAGQVTQQNYSAGPLAVQQGPQGTQASYQLGDQNLTTQISEGANPHKVALPVQMAMNHYQAPTTQHVKKPASLLRKYFAEAEEEVTQIEADRKERLRMYSQKIAERVLVKEGLFDSKPKVDWNKRAKELFAKGMDEQQVRAQLLKEGCPPNQVNVYVQAGQLEEAPIDMTGDPNDPTVYGHAKANPMSLKGRIQQARNQLKELANMAESDDLVVWQKICQLSKGGMFMGLEQNIEQVRHGIEQLAAKRKQGGVTSRGIDKNIGEQGITDKIVAAGTAARKAVDTAVNSIPRPFDEKEVANDLQKQKRQS